MSTPSQKKTQASISRFFAAKPSSPAPRPSPTAAASPKPTQSSIPAPKQNGSLFVESDDEDPVPTTATRRSISKRSWGFDEQETSAAAPPAKKARTVTPTEEDDASPPRNALTELQSPVKNTPVPSLQRQGSSKVTGPVSKYVFGSPSSSKENEVDEDERLQEKRQKQHERFVRKLGYPDSINDIKRRSGWIDDETVGPDEGAEDEDGVEEEPLPKKPPKLKSAAAKKRGTSLTPMEKQFLEVKRKHMDTIIIYEVGYKFRFFGEDARIAAKELNIVCIPGKFRFDEHPSEAHIDRFAGASIPVHRLQVHTKRLIAAGYKVGIVRQIETAALKAVGDNRNAPFVRKLTNLYTKGTYVDDVEGTDAGVASPEGSAPATGHLLCITETNAKGWGNDEKVNVGIVAVQPGTGDIIYDEFEDGFMRGEIETRLLHIAPCEFLIVGDLSKSTERLVQHLSGSKVNVFGDKARVERVERAKTAAATAYSHIDSFYSGKLRSEADAEANTGQWLDNVHKLSENVSICLSAMIKHLTEYGLEHVFDLTKNFQPFSARSYMMLNGNTLNSLEIFRNQTTHDETGSLLWVLDQTQTRFGQRLLRKWVGRPLLDQAQLQQRIDAVEELKNDSGSIAAEKLRNVISKTRYDLERSLIRIYYGKCTRPELFQVLQLLQRVSSEYAHVQSPAQSGFQAELLKVAIASLPRILQDVVSYLERINTEAAKIDDKFEFFRQEHETDDISEHKSGIAIAESHLDDHRSEAAEKLGKKRVDYVSCAGIDFLIEVETTSVKKVPASWQKISGTKKLSRFHTPEVVRLLQKRDQHKESLAAACDAAYSSLLAEISAKYQTFRDCIQSLATLDCLLSLADVASRPGYCKPNFSAKTEITVTAGRHPMVEQLLLSSYVPNDVALSTDATRALLITGPNMGGKSSYVRQVALLAIMAQIGSYVPAESATFGLLDAVFTRMGAFDNMLAGESTFMVELSETADIIKQAGPRSLVILDELGRGTSTHDGVAIAHAVLEHVVRESRCLTLFITHYQSLAVVANSFHNGELKNVHMRFAETARSPHDAEEGGEADTGEKDITFLYEVGDGVAHRSYGLNVARLANVPSEVLNVAGVESKRLEEKVRLARIEGTARTMRGFVEGRGEEVDMEALVRAVDEL